MKTDTNNLDLYIYAVDDNGDKSSPAVSISDFLYGGIVPNRWKVAWIPVLELLRYTPINTFVFHGIGIESTMPGTVWVDEVKMVEKLRWPLPGSYSPSLITSSFGDHWTAAENGGYCGSYKLLHNAIDYPRPVGTVVKASHSGTVRYAATDTKWGGYVVIESVGKVFTTDYTHVVPSVSKDMEVKAGDNIGTIANIHPFGSHLHFQLRVKEYHTSWSRIGRLPTTACNSGMGFGIEPAFPEAFIDPTLIQWQ